ncbi:epidermal growth factor receptor-like isoform X2 [Physella acuta]|uniref:epidermal growth factor receptor-like isoform X2 n=1 Tax=Physella acuta TaxID=109671 RepID=UPI0027DC309B|nr:epidermal growth factor receptor-like isoform X2 [Physella acuta]
MAKISVYFLGFNFLICFVWISRAALINHSVEVKGYSDGKVCTGTNIGLLHSADPEYQYNMYKTMYTNCTYVMGNLEINFLQHGYFDMSFLKDIKEVYGYVLIVGNHVNNLMLTNLQIIRGMTLFYYHKTEQYYSLYVALNDGKDNRGLRELGFVNLLEIMNGGVYFQENRHLCYEDTISWHHIVKDTNNNAPWRWDGEHTQDCPPCHESCYNNLTKAHHCWGAGPNMCQKLNHKNCHANCQEGVCSGPLPQNCCHPDCAGGCNGPTRKNCTACREFVDGNECVPHCAKPLIYDKSLMKNVKNPNVKYTFGTKCLKECPYFMLEDNGNCVIQCPEGKYAKDKRHCEDCPGSCPKTCKGTDEKFLNRTMLPHFQDCTVIDGSVKIFKTSFEGDPHYNISGIHPDELMVFKHVKEITGYLSIQNTPPNLLNFSFLGSLEVIHGRQQTAGTGAYSLEIIVTHARSLELISLKSVRNGNIFISQNPNLCYADTVNWNEVKENSAQIVHLLGNKRKETCEAENEICDAECDTSGCWGKGPTKCVKCKNFMYEEENLCLSTCNSSPKYQLYHNFGNKCARCHEFCNGSCNGPNNTHCESCRHVTMIQANGQRICEEFCTDTMYPDEHNICRECHPYCGDRGCNGPENVVGPQGCKACNLGLKNVTTKQIFCLHESIDTCQPGYYKTQHHSGGSTPPFQVCEKCHEFCSTCYAASSDSCPECKYFKNDKHCTKECPPVNYANPITKMCEPCHSECRAGCHGTSTSDCLACANFKVYIDRENNTFNCTPECPEYLPYTVKDLDKDENKIVCVDRSHPEIAKLLDKTSEEERKLKIILGCTIPGVTILLIIIICITYYCHKKAQNYRRAMEFTAKIAGVEDMEPLTPTNAKPDLSKMRIINEEELKRGAIIGSGAFGTVYKGFWVPHGENVKIPVAIKILQDGPSPGQSRELLEEARVMCSVDHLCCVRILAVCLKYQMCLVTQLMPHGNLLNYIRENAQHIGSKALLNWCTQIARGMAYLEERGIVHRDLAARNVLVQTPNQVKITDFGLAKLLSDSEVYYSSGGLMPIKWLALECINHRIFTHKSDVWSFGVTLWELFTLGKKPYESIRTKDVPLLLEKGERLQQPSMCTIDVYMIMVKCWMLEAESRPSFKELVDEFAKMSRDPGRYLVIEGDSLMRLPSVSIDKDEFFNGLLSDGDENLMEADDYLQPNESHRLMGPSLSRQISNMSNSSQHRIMGNHNPEGGAKGYKASPDGEKVREKMYGHLTAAARAKHEREHPHNRADSVGSRYSSDPIKYNKIKDGIEWAIDENVPNGYPMGYVYDPRSSKLSSPTSVRLPVDKDDYLEPGAAAQSLAYLDLDSKGYYQNEKDLSGEDPFDESGSALNHSTSPVSSGKELNEMHQYSNFEPGSDVAPKNTATNPVYFDSDEVWERNWTNRNGYHAVPNVALSPVHSKKNGSDSYYKSMNGTSPSRSPLVNTKVKLRGSRLDSTESNV